MIYGKVTSLGAGISAVMGAVFDNGLRLDNDLTLAIKAVVQAEESAKALSYDLAWPPRPSRKQRPPRWSD